MTITNKVAYAIGISSDDLIATIQENSSGGGGGGGVETFNGRIGNVLPEDNDYELNQIENLPEAISDLQSSIDTNTSNLSDLDSRVTNNESDILELFALNEKPVQTIINEVLTPISVLNNQEKDIPLAQFDEIGVVFDYSTLDKAITIKNLGATYQAILRINNTTTSNNSKIIVAVVESNIINDNLAYSVLGKPIAISLGNESNINAIIGYIKPTKPHLKVLVKNIGSQTITFDKLAVNINSENLVIPATSLSMKEI